MRQRLFKAARENRRVTESATSFEAQTKQYAFEASWTDDVLALDASADPYAEDNDVKSAGCSLVLSLRLGVKPSQAEATSADQVRRREVDSVQRESRGATKNRRRSSLLSHAVAAECCAGAATLDVNELGRASKNGWATFSAPLTAFGQVVGLIEGRAKLFVGGRDDFDETCDALLEVKSSDDEALTTFSDDDAQTSVSTLNGRHSLLEEELRYTKLQLKLTERKLASEREARSRTERRAFSKLMTSQKRIRDVKSEIELNIATAPSCKSAVTVPQLDTSPTFLRSIPLFKGFSESQLAKVHEAMVLRECQSGEKIIEQGDESGEEFYIVVRGRVRVFVQAGGSDAPATDTNGPLGKQVAVLSVGDYFGERALILKEPRASTCIADVSGVTCLVLDKNSFGTAVAIHGARSGALTTQLQATFSGYEHDTREGSKAGLEAYITRYSDLLPLTIEKEESSLDSRLAAVASALRTVPTTTALPKAVDAELQLLLLDVVTPELSIDGVLDRVAFIAKSVLAVEKCDVYCPVSVEQKTLVDIRTGSSVAWSGIAAAAAKAGESQRAPDDSLTPEFAAPILASTGNSGTPEVVAVMVAREPTQGGNFTKLHELAIVALAKQLAPRLELNSVELKHLTARRDASQIVTSKDADYHPAISLEAVCVDPPPEVWGEKMLRPFASEDDDDNCGQNQMKILTFLDDENENDDELMSAKRTKYKKARTALKNDSAPSSDVCAVRLYNLLCKHANKPVVVRMVLVHGDTPLTRVWESKPRVLKKVDKTLTRWGLVARFGGEKVKFLRRGEPRGIAEYVSLRDLPLATTMLVSIRVARQTLAFCKVPFWNQDSVLKAGSQALPLAHGATDTRHVKVHGPTYGAGSDSAPCLLKLHCHGVTGKDALCWHSAGIEQQRCQSVVRRNASRASVDEDVDRILNKHILYELTSDDKHLLWKQRHRLVEVPEALPKFLRAVDWARRDDWDEAYRLLGRWALMAPLEALQLLGLQYPDPHVRAYAVKCLLGLSDAELAAVMLQLTQVVKFERHHDTALNRFLLRRALRSPAVCGHALYWSLTTEKDVNDEHHRCRVLFDLYVRSCGEYRVKLGHQVLLVTKLAQITDRVKKMKAASDDERNGLLRTELEAMVLPRAFQLPLSPFMVSRGLNVARCKVMGSAQKPLWLNFHNAVKNAPPHIVIFKCGDDLRQDQLTLQVLRSMDSLWKQAGLDLQMSPYGCVATSADQGFIEVVQQSDTLATITALERANVSGKALLRVSRKYAAASEAYYGNDAILRWIAREARAFAKEDEFCEGIDVRETRPTSKKHARRQSAVALALDSEVEDAGGGDASTCVVSDFRHAGLSNRDGNRNSRRCSKTLGRMCASSTKTVTMGDDAQFLSVADLTDSVRVLMPWQRKPAEFENPLSIGLPVVRALDNFALSLAGYCVATYVLGIGDRHNDNIMLSRAGRLFHIDFGHILGNFKEKFGIKRETAPFVLTPHFERVLGGRQAGARFRLFEEMATKAFLILRHHRDLILTLLALMVDCGIPQLADYDDIKWVNFALMVDQADDSKAIRAFMDLIDESLNCKRTRTMHAIHSFVVRCSPNTVFVTHSVPRSIPPNDEAVPGAMRTSSYL